MEEPAFVQKNECFFLRSDVLEYTNTSQCRNVVSKWKSEHSAFQNTKNLWNRCIIRDVRRIFVLKSSFGVISRVFDAYMHAWEICMHVCVKYAWYDSKTWLQYKNPSNITNNASISKIFGVLKSWGFALSLRNNVSTVFCVCALQNLTSLKSLLNLLNKCGFFNSGLG